MAACGCAAPQGVDAHLSLPPQSGAPAAVYRMKVPRGVHGLQKKHRRAAGGIRLAPVVLLCDLHVVVRTQGGGCHGGCPAQYGDAQGVVGAPEHRNAGAQGPQLCQLPGGIAGGAGEHRRGGAAGVGTDLRQGLRPGKVHQNVRRPAHPAQQIQIVPAQHALHFMAPGSGGFPEAEAHPAPADQKIAHAASPPFSIARRFSQFAPGDGPFSAEERER